MEKGNNEGIKRSLQYKHWSRCLQMLESRLCVRYQTLPHYHYTCINMMTTLVYLVICLDKQKIFPIWHGGL